MGEQKGSERSNAGVPGEQALPLSLTGKAATQERILASATELFLTRGYDVTTIQQVAEHASVSRATVFWHFSDKESLFRECFSRICEPFRRSLERDFSDRSPEQRLREQVALYRSFSALHRADVGGFFRWATEHMEFRDWLVRTLLDLHNRFGGILAETLSEIVPEDEDPYPIAMAILLLLDGGLLLTYFDSKQQLGEVAERSVEAVLAMIPRRTLTEA